MCSFSYHGKTLYLLTLFLFCNNSLFYCLFNSKINYASKENMSRERIQNKNIMYMYVMNLHFFTHQIDYININQPHVDSHLIPFTLVLYANILKNHYLWVGGGGGPAFEKLTYIPDTYLFSIVSFDLTYKREL